ncbi:MAG: hypothetical protein IH571_03465 [Acholeplasmataceae bacterium]|nr:hypothetical protein [Acholeplasmataceae bacterium]
MDIDGEKVFSHTIILEEHDERNVFDVLNQDMDLDYQIFDIGIFVNGVSGHYPKEFGVTYNYWFMIYIDDEPITVGIGDIVVRKGMTISFVETSMLDGTDLFVNSLIYAYMDQYFINFVDFQVSDHHIFAAYAQLWKNGYLSESLNDLQSDAPAPLPNRSTIASTFKTLVIESAYALSIEASQLVLLSMNPENHYEAISYLNSLTLLEEEITDINTTVDLILSGLPMFMDADYAGMSLLSLSPYKEQAGVGIFIDDMIAYIKNHQTNEGIESWGSSNSASTAMVVIGLVAQGLNPRSSDFTIEDVDLIEAIMAYEMDGAFKWDMASTSADHAFATPQVVAALVSYKIFRDTWGNPPVHLFNLN